MDFINAIVLLLNYIFVPALTYGSQLALGAIFVTLIYGVLRFANFATGDMMSFGTMFAVLFTWYFQSLGVSLGFLPTALLAIPFAILCMIIYMLFIDKFVFKYYRTNKSPPVQFAMVSIGVMFLTQALVRIIIGPDDRRFFDGQKFLIKAGEFKEMTGLNEGLAIKSTQVITIFLGSIPDNKARSSLSEYALILFPVFVLFKNQNNAETKITVTKIVITWVDLIASPSFNPVISLNSPALIKNFCPSKNLLSSGPIIILTSAWVKNITPILTIAN